MSHSAESIDKLAADVDGIFDHPAFLPLKTRVAAFGLVRVSGGDVLWVNESAAAFWGTRDLRALGRNLAAQSSPGGGLQGLVRGTTVWASPRLGRLRLAHTLKLRNHVVLFRTGTDADGAVLLGFALPETAAEEDRPTDAWRRGLTDPGRIEGAGEGSAPTTVAAHREVVGKQGHGVSEAVGLEAGGLEADGLSLARRSQIAVLRDRLQAAADGAGSLRLLWRTDADDRVTQIDADTFARLGSPLSFEGDTLATVIGAWDATAGAELAAALATRATWSGITVRLPVADAVARVPWALSASPIFTPGRSFSGFRGFGTIDLRQLELAPPRERGTPSSDRPADEPLGVEPETPLAGAGDVEPFLEPHADDRSDGPAAVQPQDATPHRDVTGTPSSAPDPDRALSSANVVHLRPFQTAGAGRFGAAPHKDAMAVHVTPAEEMAAEPVPQTPPDEEGEAFRALREALLAQIPVGPDIATASDDGPHHTPEAIGDQITRDPSQDLEAAWASSEGADPASVAGIEKAAAIDVAPQPVAAEPSPKTDLIDDLPVGVLVIGAGLPLFSNPAAAVRLGYASVADLMAKGQHLVVSELSTSDTGTLVLRDAEDRAVAIPAEHRAIDWRGAAAALWTIGLPTPERAVSVASSLGSATETGEQPDSGDHGSGELLDRVDDAVALLDIDGRIRRLNRRGETWFARPGHDSAIGAAFTQLLAPDSRAAGLALLADVKGQKEGMGATPLQREVVARTIDLATMPVLLTMGGLGASGFYMTLRDVTALKRAERDRARAQRDHERDSGRLPEFLAKVSHEIRTPLNAILGFAEVMIEERFGPLGNTRYKDYLKDIHASGTQVVSLVSDLLDLSRIEAGRLELEVGALDVNKIVSETVAQMQPEAHRERVIMRMSLGARTPAVLADERSVRQIVQNLLSNAVKFNEPGGQVIVSTALSDAGTVVLRVRDTGIGMTDAEIAAALEPFQPVSAQKPSTGNGLGLPLTRALVGANGASMAIRSRPREGTLVEVAFALASADAARLPA